MLMLALPETEVQYILTAGLQVLHNTHIAEIIHEPIPCHLPFHSRTTCYYYCIKNCRNNYHNSLHFYYIFVRLILKFFVLYLLISISIKKQANNYISREGNPLIYIFHPVFNSRKPLYFVLYKNHHKLI